MILDLPVEILNLICSHAEREDLKTLRLVNSHVSSSATRSLFRIVHISPSSFSFDRAHDVVAQEHLRKQVKSLIYHFGVLGDYYAGFDDFKHEYFQTRKPGETRDPSEVTAEVLWCYSCWLEELDGQRTFELRDEQEELRALCDRMPNLESIHTLMDDCEDYINPQDYIGRRTGMVAAEDTSTMRFANLFRATEQKPLKKISARSIRWLDLIEITDEVQESLRNRMNKLDYLELGIYNMFNEAEDEDGNPRDHLRALDRFLATATDITTLKLDFDELPFESESERMLPISELILQHHWPQLREMKLEALCADEDLFVSFLSALGPSLRRLQLGDIELTRSRQENDYADVMRFFRALREELRLESAKLTGNFTNRAYQAWYVDTEIEDDDCFREQLQRYLCHSNSSTGYCDVARWPVLSDDISGTVVGNDPEVYKNFCCDSSWYWCPELLETEDFEDAFPDELSPADSDELSRAGSDELSPADYDHLFGPWNGE